MMVAELGSMGADAMLVFHRLEDGKGTYPLRLAPLPVLMLPHEGPAEELTVMFRLPVWERGVGVVESFTSTEKAVAPALVGVPVIAVPTSVGYGASLGGIAALLGMLNTCAPNVSVVNIDNGFGAACIASLINHM